MQAPAQPLQPAHQRSFSSQPESHQPRFADLNISPLTKRALAEIFGYEFCTHVQAQSLPACLAGGDVLAKAKTGTGKTIGFLIPVIESILQSRPQNGQVGALILSPTRELAAQIYKEAQKLLTFHSNIHVEMVIGGTNQNAEMQRIRQKPPQILVATPGRCLDHLTSSSPLNGMMRELRVLVCDEADNLLDMGFKPTIVKILQNLPPKEHRQALLFSATFPADVKELAKFALKMPWTEVDTVGADTQTNVQVDQFHAVVPFEQQFSYLFSALREHMQQEPNNYKVIAFFPTARQTQVFAEAFNLAGMRVFEMHSRKSQSQRTKTSDQFRAAQTAIMFSSDVSARGVDYPNVSMVVQVGVPSDKAQYVHRVGRTARAGKRGQALLVLCDFEAAFLDKLHDLPVKPAPAPPPAIQQQAQQAMTGALARVPQDTKDKAYVSWLGFYKSCPSCKFGSTSQLVGLANRFAYLMGCRELPTIDTQTIGKMGLKGVPGLNVGKIGRGGGGSGGGRGGGGNGGRGGR
ncbi:P-loop containing nucleoside triphosphate hydrolase protein [Dunaliella salina]|uniref:ATP-dependent RNA helicase n=1 Tax=Dunaliella salina TaxID=3046 RepID=A0ABQ7G838_DUNSA|nr:P-loop containing nucleoside triphosphate hydrolase protein [Dunaliella salina]|eukprot:KAF5830772.1 P-loop containing nucleoside triphosphate hydrolase protein [Dunaliella salina]